MLYMTYQQPYGLKITGEQCNIGIESKSVTITTNHCSVWFHFHFQVLDGQGRVDGRGAGGRYPPDGLSTAGRRPV